MLGQVRTPIHELTFLLGMRSTANPGGAGHAWVKTRFIDDKIHFKTYHNKVETQVHVILPAVLIPV